MQLENVINLLAIKIGLYWTSFATFAAAAITNPSDILHAVVGNPDYVSIFDIVYWDIVSGNDVARLTGLIGVAVMSMKGIADIIDWFGRRKK